MLHLAGSNGDKSMKKALLLLNLLLAGALLTGCLDSGSSSNEPAGSTPPTENPAPTPDPSTPPTGEPLPGVDAGTGSWNLRVTTTVMGTSTPVEVKNVGKPSSTAEFCNNEEVVNSYQNLGQVGGRWQQNSCTFDGTNGKIDATFTMTTPIAMTMSYVVDYYYYR